MSRCALTLALLAFLQDGGSSPRAPGKVEGLTIERRVRLVARDLVGKPSEFHRRETVKIQNGLVAIHDVTFGTRLVIRPDRKLAWVIDTRGATYSEVTFEAVAERRKRVLADLADAKKRVAGTQDAEDIDRVTIGLGAYPNPPAVEARDTGKTEQVAGRRCVGREIVINGTDHPIDVLVDPTLSDGIAYFDALAALGGFHPSVAEKLRGFGGFPLKGKVRYALFLDRVLSEEEVLSVARGEIADADFDLPADLKKVPLQGFDPDAGPKPEKPKDFKPSWREDEIERENRPIKPPDKDKKEP